MSKQKIKKQYNPEEILKDIDKLMEALNEVSRIEDIETDINKLSKKIKNTTKNIKNKYKNLDTKK